ncbi:MAG: acetylxylan esterase [Bryobacterales bacterium]|nr:acetylxylan esterase [Bryobacterales bacterium]
MTRRDLGRAALTAAALKQTGPSRGAEKYGGALDGFESKVDMDAFDPVRFTLNRHASAPLRMTFRARGRREAGLWQRRLRAKVTELLGGFPSERAPLKPVTLEVREFPSYRREKFVFQSRPGAHVLGYLLTPKAGTAPYPALVCLPGHGRGVDDIVGIDAEGRDRTARVTYQYDFAIQAVEQGLAAVALEMMAFGCRRDPVTKKRNLETTACQPTAGSALLLGETMIGWRAWDVMRAIDWIETRSELDAARVGCVGISGGGTCALFAGAVEPRLRAVMISCALNTFRDSIMSVSHCIDNYVPGILNWAEMYDVAGLIAPRPLFAEAGEKDNIFPIAASRSSFERVGKIYAALGAAAAFETEVFDGGHRFWGRQGLPFLAKNLRRE